MSRNSIAFAASWPLGVPGDGMKAQRLASLIATHMCPSPNCGLPCYVRDVIKEESRLLVAAPHSKSVSTLTLGVYLS